MNKEIENLGKLLSRRDLENIGGGDDGGSANCKNLDPCLQNYQGTNFAGGCVTYNGQCACQAGQLTPQVQAGCISPFPPF